MREAQRPIAQWMREMMEKHGISARAWALKAGCGKDTVSRAIKEGWPSVTNADTVWRLAKALEERPIGAAAAVPDDDVLASILQSLFARVPREFRPPVSVLAEMAAALRETLLLLADEPQAAVDPEAAALLARAVGRSRRP